MKVILVNGSPNEHGSTDAVLRHAAEVLQREGIETEIFWLGNGAVSGCTGCCGCRATGDCVVDEDVNIFRRKAAEADGFIFGSPVHYAAASGALTSFMDRVFFCDSGESFHLKPAAAIAVARRGGTTATLDQINKYFTITQMPVVSSRYWNMVHGMSPEEVLQDEEGMYTVRVLARNMAYFLRCIEAGRQAGVALPEKEAPKRTNFIH